MSKKKLRSRLDNLFADLEQDASLAPIFGKLSSPGWTWECDAQGCYQTCSPEIEAILGFDPRSVRGQFIQSFALDEDSASRIEAALALHVFPCELNVNYLTTSNKSINANLHIFSIESEDQKLEELRGYVQIVERQQSNVEHPERNLKETADNAFPLPDLMLDIQTREEFPKPPLPPTEPIRREEHISNSFHVSTTGMKSLERGQIMASPGSKDSPAALAIPVRLPEASLGLLEILDDSLDRKWNQDECRLVEQIADQLSLALENAHLFQSEQRRANELNVLVELSRIISENLELEEIYQTAHRIIGQLMSTDTFFINLLDKETNEFITAYMIDRGVRAPINRFPADVGFSGYVTKTKKPFISYDLREEATPFSRRQYPAVPEEDEVRSVIAVPLQFSGEVIGAISSQSYQPDTFSDYDLHLLGTFADHIGVAIKNAQLFEQTQARAEEMSILHQVSLELAQEQRDLNSVLEIITRRAMELLDADGGGIWLWRDKEQALELVITFQVEEVNWTGRRLIKGEGLVGKAYAEGKIQTVDDYQAWGEQAEAFDDAVFKSAMAVPLIWQTSAVGVLAVTRSKERKPFLSDEASLGELLAGQAAAVIQNASLYLQEQHRRQIADTLREIAQVIGATLDLREVIERMLDKLSQLIEYNTASIQLVQTGKRQLIGGRGFDVEAAIQASPPSLWKQTSDDPLISEVVSTKRPLLLSDTHADPRWEIRPETNHVRSWITAPMLIGQEVVGILTLDHTLPNAYTEDTAEMASAVAAQTAIAIQNARLFEQSQNTLIETETLYLASAELNTVQSYNDVLSALRRYTLIGQEANLVSLFFFDHPWTKEQQPEWIDILAQWSDETEKILEPRCRLEEYPLPLHLFQSDTPLLFEDLENDLRLNETIRSHYIEKTRAKSAIFFSIVVSGKWLGYVNAFFPKRVTFPENRVRQMTALVNQAGVALQNLRNIELAEQRAFEAQKRSEELGLINRVVTAVVSSTDLHLVMDTLAQELYSLFSLNSVEVALLGGDKQVLTTVAARSSNPALPSPVGMELPLEAFPTGKEVQISKRALLVADVNNASFTKAHKERLEIQNVEAMVVAPIIGSGDVLGIVSLGIGEKGRSFSDQDLRLAETLVAQLSTAIQNANLFEQIQNALAETEMLYQASAELNSIQSYDDILTILRKYTITGSKETINVTINLFDRPWIKEDIPDSYRPIARWAISPYTETPNIRFPMRTWTTVKQTLHPDVPTLITDLANDYRMDQTARSLYVERLDAKSLLFAPLNVGGSWIGFINAVYFQTIGFSDSEMRRLMALASQACVAIQNIRLLEETKRRAAQLETAAEIARDTSGTLALDTLLKRAVTLIRDRYGYYHASIFLMDESGLQASIRESTGEAGEEMKRLGHKLAVGSRSIIGYVTELGKPLVINDVTQDPIHRPNPLLPETRAELGIPLKIGNRVIGAIDVQSVEINAFNADDISVIQTLADQIAVAVDNARSYELAQQAIKETRQRVQDLSVLFEINQSLASVSMEPVEIAQIISQNLVEVMGLSRCSIFMVNQENVNLQILADLMLSKQEDGTEELLQTEQVGQLLPITTFTDLYQSNESYQPLAAQINDPDTQPALLEFMRQNNFHALILLPLTAKGVTIGFISMASIDPAYSYLTDQFNLSVTVANAAAVALENALLYEEQRLITEKLREVDKLKSQFLANMSHELRTPLNSIIGFSRVILKGIDGPINDLQKQDLSAIHNSGTHLLRLINNVLDISKIEAGKMELAFEEDVSLSDLINGVISTTIALVKDKPVRLEKIIQPDLPLICCDPTRINQVMLNLMSNASKFTEEGSITLEAGVQTGSDGNPEVIVKVIDTGDGISQEDQKKLFQPFSQVDESATRKTGGSGLGLSISRLLVEMHGGQIGIISEPGLGSTFYFTLPLPQPEPIEEAEDEQKLILTIDDERQILDLYGRYLKDSGYKVVRLSNPHLAVQRAIELKPFAITLDVMMPGRNGWEVLEELKNHPETREIPVIVCSMLEDQEKGFSLGATDYLTKPILEEDLIRALSRLNGEGNILEVLIVDDDVEDLRLLERLLEGQYKVRKAQGGLEGLAELQNKIPHAVVLDLFMPGMDGFILLEKIRSEPFTRDMPVIIFTAGDLNEDQRKRLAQFSQEMISKSNFSEEEILEIIARAIKKFNPKPDYFSDRKASE